MTTLRNKIATAGALSGLAGMVVAIPLIYFFWSNSTKIYNELEQKQGILLQAASTHQFDNRYAELLLDVNNLMEDFEKENKNRNKAGYLFFGFCGLSSVSSALYRKEEDLEEEGV